MKQRLDRRWQNAHMRALYLYLSIVGRVNSAGPSVAIVIEWGWFLTVNIWRLWSAFSPLATISTRTADGFWKLFVNTNNERKKKEKSLSERKMSSDVRGRIELVVVDDGRRQRWNVREYTLYGYTRELLIRLLLYVPTNG